MTVEEVLEEQLSARDVAIKFGVDVNLVYREAKAGNVPGARKILGRWHFDPVEIEDWELPAERVSTKDRGDGRRPNGRFAKGNQLSRGAGGGRLPRQKEDTYLKKLQEVATLEEWEQVCEVAIGQALDGDWRARKWLTDYLVGPPVKRTESTLDVRQSLMSVPEQVGAVMRLLMHVASRRGIDVEQTELRDVSEVIDGLVAIGAGGDD